MGWVIHESDPRSAFSLLRTSFKPLFSYSCYAHASLDRDGHLSSTATLIALSYIAKIDLELHHLRND